MQVFAKLQRVGAASKSIVCCLMAFFYIELSIHLLHVGLSQSALVLRIEVASNRR